METVCGYVFTPADLRPGDRKPGISAFMRIRNGADFVERVIRSHIPFLDEIVAVHSPSTDGTADILSRLERELGPKLRTFRYTDRVYPPGSRGHAAARPNAPSSMVNYSNFALAQTTRRTVTKLDDDQLAIAEAFLPVTAELRKNGGAGGAMYGFSGANLYRRSGCSVGILGCEPFSGSGDIGFFDVTADTFFTHDERYERVPAVERKRFAGFLYWHLKFLKRGGGFANYELEENPDSRFARHRARIQEAPDVIDLPELRRRTKPPTLARLVAKIRRKQRFIVERADAFDLAFPDETVADALRRTVAPEYLEGILEIPANRRYEGVTAA